jgi:hypothetical protein
LGQLDPEYNTQILLFEIRESLGCSGLQRRLNSR